MEREHALIKLKAGERQAELLQLITALQARIVDSAGPFWTLEVTGETAAVDNAFNLLKGHEIVESIRTGKIALERGMSARNGGGG